MVRAVADITEADGRDDVHRKVEALFPEGEERHLAAARIGSLLGGEESASLQELFWAVRRLFEALARETPLIVVFDDLHWAEAGLLDLIEYLLGWSSGAPVLL